MSGFLGSRASFDEDPPAIGGVIPGASVAYAFSRSQILASHDNPPRYRWALPNGPSVATVGPDGNIYSGKRTVPRGIQRTDIRAGSSALTYQIANSNGLDVNAIAFFAQAPKSGMDPWALVAGKSAGNIGVRFTAADMQGRNFHERATAEEFTNFTGSIDACFDPTGKLWTTETGSSRAVSRFPGLNGAAGALTADIILTGTEWPATKQGLAMNAAGDLFVSRYVFGTGADIRHLSAATIAGLSGTSNTAPTAIYTVSGLSGLEQIRFDYAGNLWVNAWDNTCVARIPAAQLTGVTGTVTPDIVLPGGGTLGNGSSIAPVGMLMFPGTGPVR